MRRSVRFTVTAGFTLLFISSQFASAAPSRDQYLNDLKIAQEKVERMKAAANTADALSSPVVKFFYGRYYRVGDTWEVAAWRTENPMARMTSEPNHLKTQTGRGGIFRYEVIEVKNGPVPEVVMKITQLSELGMKPVDEKVEALTLTMTDKTVQTKKAYRFVGRTQAVGVSPDAFHSAISDLELYPLDVPEVLTAKREKAKKLPELPSIVQSVADQTGYAPTLESSYWVEQDDFFGRPVQLLWQHGDPWPSYLKTSNGIAILLKQRASS